MACMLGRLPLLQQPDAGLWDSKGHCVKVQGRAARAPFSWVNILNSRLLGGPCAPGTHFVSCSVQRNQRGASKGPATGSGFLAPLRHTSRLQAGPAHPLLLGVAAVQGRAGCAHQPLCTGRAQPGASCLQGSVSLAEYIEDTAAENRQETWAPLYCEAGYHQQPGVLWLEHWPSGDSIAMCLSMLLHCETAWSRR